MSHEQVVDILMPGGKDLIAMAVAFGVYFFFSFVWWGPIWGMKWGALMGLPTGRDNVPPMTMPLLLQALGTAFLSYVLWHVMAAFSVTHDADGLVMGDLSIMNGLMGAFFMWLGFFVPIQLGRVAWEKAPWALFGINAGGHLIALSLMSIVFALM